VNGVEISDGGSKGSTLKPDRIEDSSNVQAGGDRQKNKTLCWWERDGWTGFFQFAFPN